jgi:hypothetical protein
MDSASPPEFGPNGAVINSPSMTDEMRSKIDGSYRAPPVPQLPWGDRLLRVAWWYAISLVLVLNHRVPVWLFLLVFALWMAEYFRNGLGRDGVERWAWRTAMALSAGACLYYWIVWLFG